MVPHSISIEHVTPQTETGPVPMRNAMRSSDPAIWQHKERTMNNLVQWWSGMPSYNPDWEPEYLMRAKDLTTLEKEVFTIAAVRRVRPALLHSTELMSPVSSAHWMKNSKAAIYTAAVASPVGEESSWWYRCFFEGLDPRFHSLVEQQLRLVAPSHSFVLLANSLDSSLLEVLNSMNKNIPSTPLSLPIESINTLL